MHTPIVFDGRNLFDPNTMRDLGFQYYPIGRPPTKANNNRLINRLVSIEVGDSPRHIPGDNTRTGSAKAVAS
jgi:hypothetical protein